MLVLSRLATVRVGAGTEAVVIDQYRAVGIGETGGVYAGAIWFACLLSVMQPEGSCSACGRSPVTRTRHGIDKVCSTTGSRMRGRQMISGGGQWTSAFHRCLLADISSRILTLQQSILRPPRTRRGDPGRRSERHFHARRLLIILLLFSIDEVAVAGIWMESVV